MKTVYTIILLLTCVFMTQAKSVKINHKAEITPFNIKIERAEVKEGNTLVYCKIKQRQNFSYNISLDDCWIKTSAIPEKTKGELAVWNEVKKPEHVKKAVRDNEFESFVLSFPGTDIIAPGTLITLKIGDILSRNQKEIVIENLKIKK